MEGSAELQEVAAANPEEIELMDEEENEEDEEQKEEKVTIEQKSVPDAVFGAVLERPQAPAEKGRTAAALVSTPPRPPPLPAGQVGALQRFRNRAGQE